MTDLMHARPVRVAEVEVTRGPDGAVVRREDSAAVVMNPTALALWELCDGHTAVSEMVGAVAALFKVDSGRARADVETALDDMRAMGVIR